MRHNSTIKQPINYFTIMQNAKPTKTMTSEYHNILTISHYSLIDVLKIIFQEMILRTTKKSHYDSYIIRIYINI